MVDAQDILLTYSLIKRFGKVEYFRSLEERSPPSERQDLVQGTRFYLSIFKCGMTSSAV